MSEFSFTRSTTINAPAATVYERLIDFKRWPEWSPWEGLDPDLQRDYSEQTAGPGAHYAWSGNRKAGQGSMTITDAHEPTKVAIDLSFLKPFKADNKILFALTETAGATTVDWTMTGRNDGLVSKVFSKLMPVEKLVGKDFDKGLAALKERAEADVAAAA